MKFLKKEEQRPISARKFVSQPKITFIGASGGTVTGSKYLLEYLQNCVFVQINSYLKTKKMIQLIKFSYFLV